MIIRRSDACQPKNIVPVELLGLFPLYGHVLPNPFTISSIHTSIAIAADKDTHIRNHYTRIVKCALQEMASVALRILKPRHDRLSIRIGANISRSKGEDQTTGFFV